MKQRLKLKDTGSIMNYFMGNNNTQPVVGNGATILSYSDRNACEVISISDDGKTILLEWYDAIRSDKNGMSEDQNYDYMLNGNQFKIVWKYGAWRTTRKQIFYTDEALKLSLEERRKLVDGNGTKKLVKGLTFVKQSLNKVNIIFGIKQSYYDYSF